MVPRPFTLAAPLLLACAGPWLISCGETCTTDGDCADGICVNGQCRGGGGADAASAADASVGFDLSFADIAVLDRPQPDTRDGDDAATPDAGATHDGARFDSSGGGDAARADTATSVDAGSATDAADPDVATAADAAGPDVYSGLVGAPCRDHGDCDTPFGAYCLDSWPGGYCSAPCNYEGGPFECGQGAECYCEMMDSMGCAIASCYQTCWLYTGDCRDDYRCEDPDWLGYLGDEDLCVP